MISASDVKELREKTGAGMLDCKKALEENNGNMEQAIDWLREKGISKAAKKADRIAAEGLTNIVIDGNKAVIVEVNSETDFVAKNEEFKSFISKVSNLVLNSEVTDVESALTIPCEEGTLNDVLVAITAKIGEKISFRRFEKITKNDNQVFGSYLHLGGKIASLILLEGSKEDVAKDVAMQAAAMKPKYIRIADISAEELEREKEILKEQAINEGKPAEIAEKMVVGRINKFYQEVCLEEQSFVKNGDITIKQFVESNSSKINNMIRYEVGEGLEKRTDNFAEEVMNQINNK
jgi:elongation factor Ts